jgi:hypothetical protein
MTSVAATKARNITSAVLLWGAGAAARMCRETILENKEGEILRNDLVFRTRLGRSHAERR